jgi:large subunit ribosomal protein L15
MKLHDLRPAKGAHHARKRVGRGIAAGGGKTAGRGTKGQKARAGAAIPAWFEGGQTPLQQRIPKLHGFKNRFRIEYEVVNLGRITALVDAGIFEPGDLPGAKKAERPALITINQEILRAAGLVSTLKKPLKILGNGDLSTALFVVADAFSRSAVTKIEAAGGSVQVLEVPSEPLAALGLDLVLPSTSAGDEGHAEPHDHDHDHDHADHAAPAATAKAQAKAPVKAAAKPKASAKASVKAPAAKVTTAKAAKPAKPAPVKAAASGTKTAKPAPAAKAAKPAKAAPAKAAKPSDKGAGKTSKDA